MKLKYLFCLPFLFTSFDAFSNTIYPDEIVVVD